MTLVGRPVAFMPGNFIGSGSWGVMPMQAAMQFYFGAENFHGPKGIFGIPSL